MTSMSESHWSLNIVPFISPESSKKVALNSLPVPLLLCQVLISDLEVQRTLIVHLLPYGDRDSIGDILPCWTLERFAGARVGRFPLTAGPVGFSP
jgi:hypothetical protein